MAEREPEININRVTFSQFYGEFSEFKRATDTHLKEIKTTVEETNREVVNINKRCVEHSIRLTHVEEELRSVKAGATPKEKAAIVGSYVPQLVMLLKTFLDILHGVK